MRVQQEEEETCWPYSLHYPNFQPGPTAACPLDLSLRLWSP